MKLGNYLETYYWYSEKASDIARQLSFAGIAVIWIFKKGDGISTQIPSELILPLGLLCFALACDLLQYTAGTIIWDIFHRYHEIKLPGKESEDIKHPVQLTYPMLSFFWIKIISVVAAYAIVIRFFWDILNIKQ